MQLLEISPYRRREPPPDRTGPAGVDRLPGMKERSRIMSREEMLKRIEDQLRGMNREELEQVNAFLDELEKEYPPETEAEGK